MNAQSKVEAATLSSAMALAFGEIEGATKAAVNPHFGKKYADLSAVLAAIKPPLIKHGLFFTQRTQPSPDGVLIETFLHHATGEQMSLGSLYVPADKRDAQKFGSALSYARRYSLLTAFGVPTDDDDGNAASKGAPERVSTGEAPPAKAEKLEGPYASPSALKAAIRAFAESLRVYEDDLAGFDAWMQTPEVVELEKAALRYLPAWWETGDEMPAGYEPIASRIARKTKELEELETLRNVRTPIDAG